MSLRLRLTLWYTGILALALLLVSVAVYFTLSFTLNQQINQFLNSRAQQYARALLPGAAGGPRGPAFVRELVANAVVGSNPDTYAQFVAPDGTPQSFTNNLPAGWPLDKNLVDDVLKTGQAASRTV